MKMKYFMYVIIISIYFKSSISQLSCPEECECYFLINKYHADCSGRMLETIPESLDTEIEIINLSQNQFNTIPPEISSYFLLEKLNMSGNRINVIKPNALSNLTSLIELDLSRNEINNWNDINPNEFLLPANKLKRLILSNNNLRIFSQLNRTDYLVSDSLEILELSSNGIIVIGKVSPLSRLPILKSLILSHNPLKWMMPLISPTLEQLDISHCELSFVSKQFLDFLPRITQLYISHNHKLIFRKENSLRSLSLKELDVSSCNMDAINVNELPNLENLNLNGNMFRNLLSGIFANNSYLEYLDLSSNAIGEIQQNAFLGLTSLKQLNLSVNFIANFNSDTFAKMPKLIELILSRNYISNINKLRSPSIKVLDISVCEIQYLEHDAFQFMPSLVELNLARNLISYMPSIKSNSLQILDLSFNRISVIDNLTFQFLPELTILHISENRFTSTWKESYFLSNTKLTEITMHDNMWRCDCYDEDMKTLFFYLTAEPPKVLNIASLTCHSPANVSGNNWIRACYEAWYPSAILQSNRALNFLVVLLVAFFLCFIIIYLVRRSIRKKVIIEEQNRLRILMEARERVREAEMRREQEEQRNAPDPRDLVSPPSYNEALLMPKLDSSFHSLSNLDTSHKKQRKRAKRRTRSSGDLLDENTFEERQPRRSRSKSSDDRRRNRSHSTNEIDIENHLEEEQPLNESTNRATTLHESNL